MLGPGRTASTIRPTGRPSRHLAVVVGHPGPLGGMERFARFVVGTALRDGWSVTVALSGRDIYADPQDCPSNQLSIDRVDWVDDTFAGDRAYQLRSILQRRQWFRKARPDVALFVQSSNTPFRASVVGARLAGIPVVMTHRTMPWIRDFVSSRRHLRGILPGLGLHNRKQILKTRFVAELADTIVFNSHAVQHAYERDYRYPLRKSRVIPNAISPPTGEPEPYDAAGPVTIGYVGRLAVEKRVDLLLRAVAAMDNAPEVRLLICGDGPDRDALKAMAVELGIRDRVAFRGHVEDLAEAYRAMDIVALCSRREASSNAVLEALAFGTAVVTSDVGGLPELLGHGEWGCIVPGGDVVALAKGLQRLVTDPQLRRDLGRRGRAAAIERHDPDDIGRAWIECLSQAAKQRRRLSVAPRIKAAPELERVRTETVHGVLAGQH